MTMEQPHTGVFCSKVWYSIFPCLDLDGITEGSLGEINREMTKLLVSISFIVFDSNPGGVTLVTVFLLFCMADYIYLSGCDGNGINCHPLMWRTIFEIYEEAGVS